MCIKKTEYKEVLLVLHSAIRNEMKKLEEREMNKCVQHEYNKMQEYLLNSYILNLL